MKRQDLRRRHAKNRARALQAIVQKNQLRQMVEETRQQIAEMRARADWARRRGEDDRENNCLRAMEQHEAMLVMLCTSLRAAEESVAAAKAAIRREEELLRDVERQEQPSALPGAGSSSSSGGAPDSAPTLSPGFRAARRGWQAALSLLTALLLFVLWMLFLWQGSGRA